MKGKKHYIKNIKSKHILLNVFSYIKNNNFKFELFKYSKLFQNKLGINYIEYSVEKYLDNSNFVLKLFCPKTDLETLNINLYDELNSPIIKKSEMEINEELQKKYLLNYLKKLSTDIKLYIEPNSQFFDLILEKGFLDKFFIKAPISDDDKINVKEIFELDYNDSYKNYYNLLYEKLNKSNFKNYSLSFYILYQNEKKKNVKIKDIKIDFNKIKKISSEISFNSKYTTKEDFTKETINFYKDLLNIENLQNNLVYLNLEIIYGIKYKNFQILNNFKSLLYLQLKDFKFDPGFILEIKTLKTLKLYFCSNIGLSQITCLNLKELNYYCYEIYNTNSLLKFPELEQLHVQEIVIDKFIDFNSLNKLNKVKVLPRNKYSCPINIVKKNLCKVKSLKNIELEISNEIKDDEILKNNDENNSVENLIININFTSNNEFKLDNLLKIFPNTKDVSFFIFYNKNRWNLFDNSSFEINENKNLFVNKLYINIDSSYFHCKLYCQSFEKLKEIKFHFYYINFDLEKAFPIFNKLIINKNNNIIFKSLTTFEFRIFNYTKENLYNKEYYLECKKIGNIIENIYYNIEIMPNLQNLIIKCCADLKEDFYKTFIRKVLSLNLNIINIEIFSNQYEEYKYFTLKELKNIFPEVNYANICEIKIFNYGFI